MLTTSVGMALLPPKKNLNIIEMEEQVVAPPKRKRGRPSLQEQVCIFLHLARKKFSNTCVIVEITKKKCRYHLFGQ